jgi:hypothetical protein
MWLRVSGLKGRVDTLANRFLQGVSNFPLSDRLKGLALDQKSILNGFAQGGDAC